MKSKISWLTNEMIDEEKKRKQIIENRDIDGLFELTENMDFVMVLREILINDCTELYNPTNLSQVETTLFLCIFLEDAAQGDSVLGFLQEDYSNYAEETISALVEIGAVKSADIIKQVINLMLKDGSWFYKNANEKAKDLMKKFDEEFLNYPDGHLCELYRKYAEKHKKEFYLN